MTDRSRGGARAGVMVSSSGVSAKLPSGPALRESESVSVSTPTDESGIEIDDKGMTGVEGGYSGETGTLERSGSTRACQGPWNGLPSRYNSCKSGKRHSQLGSACILFLRMLSV